jgi:hypothetical protein
MDRAEAEAIYDSGREACVEFILELAARVGQHKERLARLEAQARQDSRTSSKPPSSDPPKTRAQRRPEARAKATTRIEQPGLCDNYIAAPVSTSRTRLHDCRAASDAWIRNSHLVSACTGSRRDPRAFPFRFG